MAVQIEVEEAILKQVAGLCDEADVLCRAHEEEIMDAVTRLPVWGEPKDLFLSLQGPDAPGTS